MLRARPDKGLEVYVGDRLAGWLLGPHCNTQCRVIRLTKDDGPHWLEDAPLAPAPTTPIALEVDSRIFKLMERCWSIDRDAMSHTNKEVLERRIAETAPLYAESYSLPHRDAIQYRWQTVKCSEEDYEWIFDYCWFEPVDTHVDHDSYIERRLVYMPNVEPLIRRRVTEVVPGELIEPGPLPEERAMAKLLEQDINIALSPILTDEDLAALAPLDAA